jgi:hypothetical protein
VKLGLKPLAVLLVVLGIGDLALVPAMIAANHHTAGTPPVPAIVAAVIIGVTTLISAAGLARGWRRAVGLAITCRTLDGISAGLGVGAHPSALLASTGALWLVLSAAAIVLLVRLSPRRASRRAARASAGGLQSAPAGKQAS